MKKVESSHASCSNNYDGWWPVPMFGVSPIDGHIFMGIFADINCNVRAWIFRQCSVPGADEARGGRGPGGEIQVRESEGSGQENPGFLGRGKPVTL